MPIKTIDNLCRICVQESGAYKHIYDQYILDIRLADVINDLCQLNVQLEDGLPEFVCRDCHDKLLEFHKFKQTSHEGKTALLSIQRKLDEITVDEVKVPIDEIEVAKPNESQPKDESEERRLNVDSINKLLEVQIKEEPEDPLPDMPDDYLPSLKTESTENDSEEITTEKTKVPVEEMEVAKAAEPQAEDEWSERQLNVDSINQLLEVQIKEEPEDSFPDMPDDYLPTVKTESIENDLEEDTDCDTGPGIQPPDGVAMSNSVQSSSPPEQMKMDRVARVASSQSYMILRIGNKDKRDRGVQAGDASVSGRDPGGNVPSEDGTLPRVLLVPVRGDQNAINFVPCGTGTEQERQKRLMSSFLVGKVPGISGVNSGTNQVKPPLGVIRRRKRQQAAEFKCAICGSEFRTKPSIVYHLKVPETANAYKCDKCDVNFRNRCAYDRHPCVSTGPQWRDGTRSRTDEGVNAKRPKRHTCTICSRSFSQSNYLKTHQMTHSTEERQHTCELCGQSFTNRGNLSKHMSLHSGDKPFCCKVCARSFSRKHHLRLHMVTHVGDMPVSCSVCSESFTQRSDLSKHMLTHTVDKPHACGDCTERFSEKAQLDRHKLSAHDPADQKHKCTLCPETFAQRSELAKHMAVHKPDKPHVCEICFRGYTQRGHLNEHMMNHKGIKPHACEICSKAFVRRSTLMHHLEMHRGGRKMHPCSLCEKTFTEKGSLTKHMLTHTGEKPYSCSVCQRPFRQKNNLDQHMLLHTGKKLHTCGVCAKSFASKSNLNQHMIMHTSIAAFKCHQCPYVFQTQAQLEKHLRVHLVMVQGRTG